MAQQDELEPNLKKILHRNETWGSEAIVMWFHLPISKKSNSVAPALWFGMKPSCSENKKMQNCPNLVKIDIFHIFIIWTIYTNH